MKLVQRDREEGTGEEGVEICTGTLRALDAMLTSWYNIAVMWALFVGLYHFWKRDKAAQLLREGAAGK